MWDANKLRWKRILRHSVVCFGFLVFLVSLFWEAGREVLREWIYPGNAAVTRQALMEMASYLRAGVGIEEAVLVFCREILAGA